MCDFPVSMTLAEELRKKKNIVPINKLTVGDIPVSVTLGEELRIAAAAGFFFLPVWPLLKAREPSRWWVIPVYSSDVCS